MKNKATENKNFSLIELIIIIIVIVMFSSIITSATQKALKNKVQVCKGHLGKISMGQAMYAADNNNNMAAKLYQLNTYLGYKKNDIPAETGCPAVPPSLKRKKYYATEYGKNGHILLNRGKWTSSGNPNEIRCNLDLYKTPDKTMLYMDYPPEPKGGYGAVLSSSKWLKKDDKTAYRHKGRANCLYIDGHVEELVPKFKSKRIFWGY